MTIGTIDEEMAACRERMQGATHGVHLHHEFLMERIVGGIEQRLDYILQHKPEHERALRFHCIQPVSSGVNAEYWQQRDAINAEYQQKRAAIDAEYLQKRDAIEAEYHPRVCTAGGCTWDGQQLVFGEVAR